MCINIYFYGDILYADTDRKLTDGFVLKINKQSSSQGIRYNKRWRRQIVGTCQGIDATFEVTITGQNSDSNEVSLNRNSGSALYKNMPVLTQGALVAEQLPQKDYKKHSNILL